MSIYTKFKSYNPKKFSKDPIYEDGFEESIGGVTMIKHSEICAVSNEPFGRHYGLVCPKKLKQKEE